MSKPGSASVQAMSRCVLDDAQAAESARTMTPAIVDAMWSSGLMRYMNPVEAGGAEPSFADMIETWIEMAYLDGSFGWTIDEQVQRGEMVDLDANVEATCSCRGPTRSIWSGCRTSPWNGRLHV